MLVQQQCSKIFLVLAYMMVDLNGKKHDAKKEVQLIQHKFYLYFIKKKKIFSNLGS